MDLFVSTHCEQNNKPRTKAIADRLLQNHFMPSLRRESLGDISTDNIAKVLDRLIAKGQSGAANHAFAAVCTFFAGQCDGATLLTARAKG